MSNRISRLRINPPRRRESERMKTRSASAASTPTSAISASSVGDTIEVAQRSSDDRVESMTAAPAESVKDAASTGEGAREAEPQTGEPVQADGEDDEEMEDAVRLSS